MIQFTITIVLAFTLAVVTALPAKDPVIIKLGSGLRYQYARGPDDTTYLLDSWLKASDLSKVARYDPDRENVYHLFTRQNPTVSQPLLFGNSNLLQASNFDPRRRTVYLIHGWMSTVVTDYNAVVVPAFLQAEDVNVIAVDWGAGAFALGAEAVLYSVISGEAGARFLNWLNNETGASPADCHIAGYSLGAHQAGVAGRNVDGTISYITATDPANVMFEGQVIFRPDDGGYTEAIHTNSRDIGIGIPVAHVDFYPNGGNDMPGCNNSGCNHARAYYYFAESIISGGFTGRECATYEDARAGTCNLPGTLSLGGLRPKTGSSGLYYLQTAAAPPFSLG